MDPGYPTRAIAALEAAAENVTKRTAMPDDGTGVDLLARLDKVIADLVHYFKDCLVEMPTGVTGENYKTVEKGGKNDYSFNPSAILRDVASALEDRSGMACTPEAALAYAVNEGAARLSWTQSKVEKMLAKLGVAMTIEPAEVEDDVSLAAHVGKVWQPGKTGIEPVERMQ